MGTIRDELKKVVDTIDGLRVEIRDVQGYLDAIEQAMSKNQIEILTVRAAQNALKRVDGELYGELYGELQRLGREM